MPESASLICWGIMASNAGIGFDRMMAAHRAGARSLMAVPLTARGVIMGMVVLYRLAGSKPFTPADLSLARDLVSRASVAVDNARHYTRERATALALQRGLLPRRIPEVPGLELAYRYVPAENAAEVGGGSFAVIPLPPPRPPPRVPGLAPRPARGHRPAGRRVPGPRRARARAQHPGPVPRRAGQKPCRRYQPRHAPPRRHPRDHQPAAGHPGLQHPADHTGPQPGRRHRRSHGPNLTPGNVTNAGWPARPR